MFSGHVLTATPVYFLCNSINNHVSCAAGKNTNNSAIYYMNTAHSSLAVLVVVVVVVVVFVFVVAS
jgi:hypothetical protein